MPIEHISQMFKDIKSNKFLEDPLQNIKGGSSVFNSMKTYLDMIFLKKKDLQQEQKDSFQRLIEIREKEEEEKNQLEKEKKFQQDNEVLAQKQKEIEIAQQKEMQIKEEAEEKKQIAQNAQIELENANEKVILAQKKVEESKTNNDEVYKEIQTQNENAKIAEKEVQKLYEEMQNKELVLLEESKEAQEDNAVIEEIEKLSLQNRLEIKHNDILY